jgi:predicted metal-binding membrane protein
VSSTSLDRRSKRSELEVATVVVGVAVAAWALTANRMAGMDAAPGAELGGLGWFAISWLLMMTAMMLPALMPAVIACVRRAGRPGEAGPFVAGYLAVWLGAGLVAYGAFESVRSLQFGFLAWGDAGRWVAAGAIAAAGVYQLTPSKDACLRRCRDHLTMLRDQRRGGLGLGIQHGGFCVGCSWVLMVALFGLGVMNLTWMAVVAALIAAERLLPRPAPLVVALILVCLAVCVAVIPGDLPAFNIPGSQSVPAMQMR